MRTTTCNLAYVKSFSDGQIRTDLSSGDAKVPPASLLKVWITSCVKEEEFQLHRAGHFIAISSRDKDFGIQMVCNLIMNLV